MAFVRENKKLKTPTLTLFFWDFAAGKRRSVNRPKGDFKNKSQALKEAIKLEEKSKETLNSNQNSMRTLRESGIKFIENNKRGTVSDEHVDTLSIWFGLAEGILGSDIPVDQITVVMCQGVMQTISTEKLAKGEKVYSIESRRKFLKAMRSLFDYLVDAEIINRNPWHKVKMPPKPLPKMTWLTPEEFDALIASLENSWGAWRERRLRYELQIGTGGRLKEVKGIRWGDIDFERDSVRLMNAQKGKGTKHAERFIPLTDRLRDALLAESEGKKPNHHVLSLQFNWRRDLIKDAKRAKINKPISPYTFRHTFGTWLAHGEASIYKIQALMGHEDHTTTMNYIHMGEIVGKEVMLNYGGSGYKSGYKPKAASAGVIAEAV